MTTSGVSTLSTPEPISRAVIFYKRLRFDRGAALLPATTPTQYDPEVYKASLDRLAARQPRHCYLTHFGAIPHTAAHVDRLKAQLDAYADPVAGDLAEPAVHRHRRLSYPSASDL